MDQQASTPVQAETMTPIAPTLPAPQAPEKQRPPGATPPPRRRLWIWILVLALLGAGGYYYWSKKPPATPGSANGAVGGRKGQGANAGASPVDAAKAVKGNIGVYVTGLGAVTPIYTVTVKAQVTGQLMEVHYKESDIVHKGDALAEIAAANACRAGA